MLPSKEIRFKKSLCHVLFPRIMRSIIYWFTLAYRKILQRRNCDLWQAWTVGRSQQGYRRDFFINVIDSQPLVIESPSTRGSRAFAATQLPWPRVVSAVNVHVAVTMLSDHEQIVPWKFKKVAKTPTIKYNIACTRFPYPWNWLWSRSQRSFFPPFCR